VRIKGVKRPLRHVLLLTERRIDRCGKIIIAAEPRLAGWTASLTETFTPKVLIAPHADHGIDMQFHCKSKSDMDLTRLTSGEFATNCLARQL
jgi:hypothetical protein